MEWLSNPEIWVAFLTLTALEIVLGIDNIIFISILVSRLPKEQQPKARFFGLALAMVTFMIPQVFLGRSDTADTAAIHARPVAVEHPVSGAHAVETGAAHR